MPLTPDTFKALALEKGLTLTDEESERVRELVQAALALMKPVREALVRDSEPVAPSATP